MGLKLFEWGKLEKGFKQFLAKTALFILLFILFSGIVGINLYSNGLLEKWKFEIYGRLGYIILFSIAGFILVYRERLLKIESFRYKIKDFIFFVFSIILLLGFYFLEKNIFLIELNLINIIWVHAFGLLIFLFLGLGVYGGSFVWGFFRKFGKEIGYFFIFGAVCASLMGFAWSLWPYLSLFVTKAVYFLLNFIGDVKLIPPRTIIFKDFGAQIGEACSGIYSMFLFSALYLFIIFLDWNKVNKKRAVLLLIPAVLGAFLINIIRVFLLFVIGAFVSKEIALGMYHSYTGMIFFLIYFGVFWFLFYNWMKKREFREVGFVKKKYKNMMGDSLYRNSIYLIVGTLLMSVLGFIFWMIGARLFSTEQVGLATTLISVMGLITSFSLLGFNSGLIRYLPSMEERDKKINTSFTLIAIVTVIISAIFLLSVRMFSPKLMFIHDNVILAFVFIFFMVFASFNSLIDSVFIAYRSAKFILLKNSIYSLLKIALLSSFVWLGAYGIFSSHMAGLIVGFFVLFFILIFKFDYKPKFAFYDSIIRKIGRYSFGNYLAGFIGGLPSMVVPILILNKLGAESSAYYYMAMMIATLLFTIPQATSNSLFAEGSYDIKNIKIQIKKAFKIIALLLIPAILIVASLGQYVLLLFGKEYSVEGFRFLQLMAFSGVFVGMNGIFGTLLRIKKRIRALIVISVISMALILGLSYLLVDYGLWGIGLAWLIGQAVISGVYWVCRNL